MAVVYSDRAQLFCGGVEVLDLQSLTINLNLSVKTVPTFSSTHTSKGWVRGNKEITFSAEVAVQSTLGSAKLEAIDFDKQNVAIQFLQGADKYLLTGIAINSMSQTASGVGSEARKSFQGIALDLTDLVGNSALFPTSLTSLA